MRGPALAAMAALWLCAPAWGQEPSHHQHPPQDAELHLKFYSTWMMPDNPAVSCCNQKDCYPVEARWRGGHWHARRREDGKWLLVPASRVELNRDSPDGRNHLCAPPPERGDIVFCFIAGSGT